MRILTNSIITISLLLTLYFIYLHLIPFDVGKIILGIVSIILLIVPIIALKFSKVKIEKYIILIYYFFLFVSFILGGLFQLYYHTLYFDLFVHGIFGLLLSIIIGTKLKVDNWKHLFLVLIIVLAIGFLWETLEFVSDVFLGTDHQRKISGATDTMTDLLIAVLGSFVYCFYTFCVNKIKQ